MMLVIYYVILTLFGDFLAVVLCLWLERVWPSLSLPTFLTLYFGILWGAWVLAVRLTEPKVTTPARAAALHDQPTQ
jgi:hypothetical protein